MSADIRIRACLAVVHDDKILLVPHYNTDVGPVQWVIPGGRVAFGESLQEAVLREFREETGLQARITGLLDVSEVILPEKSWHSITITFFGSVVGGELAPEADHRYGTKVPRWFSPAELEAVKLSSRRNRGKGMSFDAERYGASLCGGALGDDTIASFIGLMEATAGGRIGWGEYS
jgi:8-oxo-dGTP diphosphatase